jgi:hypothetical protein
MKNPIGPVLAARLRSAVADALDSKFGREAAQADLSRER